VYVPSFLQVIMSLSSENQIRQVSEAEFFEIINHIPSFQRNASRIIRYYPATFDDVARLRGGDVSEQGLKLKNKFYPWKLENEQHVLLKEQLLADCALCFPQDRLLEDAKPLFKA